MELNGINVSHHNGEIDWAAVKPNINFAIVRMGYGDDYEDGSQDDRYFKRNIEGVIKNDIPFGVYLYSYAEDLDGVYNEIGHTKRLLKEIEKIAKQNGKENAKPFAVYYSLAEDDTSKIKIKTNKDIFTISGITFCNLIGKYGYRPGVYMSESGFKNDVDWQLVDSCKDFTYNGSLWVGKFGDTEPNIGIKGVNFDIWNYSDSGTIAGINGTNVCLDKMLKDIIGQ